MIIIEHHGTTVIKATMPRTLQICPGSARTPPGVRREHGYMTGFCDECGQWIRVVTTQGGRYL